MTYSSIVGDTDDVLSRMFVLFVMRCSSHGVVCADIMVLMYTLREIMSACTARLASYI